MIGWMCSANDPVPEWHEGMSEKVERLGAAEAVARAGVAAATTEMADLQTTHAEEKAALEAAHTAAIAEQTKKYNFAAEALAAREQDTSRFLGQITNVLTAPR